MEAIDSVCSFTPSESIDMSMPLACQNRVSCVTNWSYGELMNTLTVTLAPPGSSAYATTCPAGMWR